MKLSVLVVCKYMLVCTLLAGASDKQSPLSSGSGESEELLEHTYTISCDLNLDGKCHDSLESISNNTCKDSGGGKLVINIRVPLLQLKRKVTFQGLESLSISGDTELNTVIACQKGVIGGLVFSNISSLELRDLTFVNCGAVYPVGNYSFKSAITIFQSKDVLVMNVTIERSDGIGMSIFNHQGGLVQIISSSFTENMLVDIDSGIQGGGGVHVGNFEQKPKQPITFQFTECTFEGNVVHTRYYDYLYTDDLGEAVSGHGIGGGAAILLEKGLRDIHVLFTGCVFRQNIAFKGAGLSVDIEGDESSPTRNISVRVENSIFEENGCNSTASGGGMSLDFSPQNRTNFDKNEFKVTKVTFHKNCAQFGGGLYFYSGFLQNAKLSNTLTIDECNFTNNSAHTGSAVDITPNVFERLSSGIQTKPVFRNCRFSCNTVIVNYQTRRTQTTYGIATVYVSRYDITFIGYNRFDNNLGSAVHIVGGIVNMSQSSVDFIKNHGFQGGAVALIGESAMIVGRYMTYRFVNNTAIDSGGAVYTKVFDNHDITSSKTCFIQYYDTGSYYLPVQEWNVTITFSGNRADSGKGHSIFATSLYSCQSVNLGGAYEHQFELTNVSDVFTVRGIEFDTDPLNGVEGEHVSTEGALLQYDKGYPLEVIPGEQFSHGVTIMNDLHNQVRVVLLASIKHINSNVHIDTAFSSCVGERLVLRGQPGEVENLYLHTATSRLSYIKIKVKLVDCPPGFIYSETSETCVCNANEYIAVLSCNTTVFYSYITQGFWIGMVSDAKNESRRELVTGYCPHCKLNDREVAVKLPQRHSELNEVQCGSSRTGVACGSCATGYTTFYHSPNYECQQADETKCRVGWFFYIISELVPVTAVFIAVVTLNISFTSGSVQGFILFSQLLSSLHVDASGIITYPPALSVLYKGYEVLYGFFNLDFFEIKPMSFCLWKDASALDMLAFKYVTIVYALLLVLLVVWFMNKCGGRCLGKWIRITTVKSSVIHGISAFLVLCYSQCIRISLKLLNTSELFVRENSNFTVSTRVWLDSNIDYFSRKHQPYALLALFFLLTVGIVPPLLLLSYPLINKVLGFFGFGESRVAIFICQKLRISYLKPLLDSFQGSFKDNFRFFAGLYFVYRWIILILTITLSDFDKVYTAVEMFIIVILILHALCQPYASKVHNMVDTLLISNLALINAITFGHYYKVRTKAGKQAAREFIKSTASIQLILIYLPILIMGVYVVMLVCRIGCKRLTPVHTNAKWTKSIALQKLQSSFSKEDSSDDELPHRLIAGNADYKCFEDIDIKSEESGRNDTTCTY